MVNYNRTFKQPNCCGLQGDLECDKYKERSDELYLKAGYIHEEVRRLICEAKELDLLSYDYDIKSKEACAQSKLIMDNAKKLEAEANNLLDMASFYGNKASECAKNESKAYTFKSEINNINKNCYGNSY